MSMLADLKAELKKLEDEHGIEISAVVSRSGVPIAWNMASEAHVETFATLSATILGASEVVYADLGRVPPKHIFIESQDGTFIATPLGTKALLVGMSKTRKGQDLMASMDKVVSTVKGVLSSERTGV
jgi:predicted regulator of Ras-like GTPase activity (Roadblock/LC7/MglB family)